MMVLARMTRKKDSTNVEATTTTTFFAAADCAISVCSNIGTNQIAVYDDYSDSIIPCFVCGKHYKELLLGYYDIGGKKKDVLKETVH
jgi:hypothetical protein